MDSIFKKPQLKAQSNRNAFPIGETRVFHAPFGAIIPFECFRLSPNDYIEITPENKTIIEPLMTPAFIRLKEHIDYYAIPYSQLWKPFDNFITQQDNYFSKAVMNAQNGAIPPNVPTMDGGFIAKVLRRLSQVKDEHGFSYLFGALRLLDGLGYGNFFGMMQDFDQESDEGLDADIMIGYRRVNPFALLAYQKIYYDYFRNPKYEECDTNAYNIDDIAYSVDMAVNSGENRFQRMLGCFKMHYRWMKKDYFTSVEPNVLPDSSQIGFYGIRFDDFDSNNDSTRVTGSNFGVPGADGSLYGQQVNSYNTAYTGKAINSTNTDDQIAQGESITAARLRLMFAYDKLLRRMREAGGTYDAQMQAIFGVKPNMGREGKCIYIGGQTNRLYTKTVTNQSETGDYGLGAMGGQVDSYNQGRRKLKFHAKDDHYIVIGVYSTSIDNLYPSFMVDRMNTATGRFDWFNRYMEMLGSQTLFRDELNFLLNGENPYTMMPADRQKDIIGYVRRYSEYKTGIDKAMGLFASKNLNAEMSTWVAKWSPRFFGRNAGEWGDEERDVAPLDIRSMTYNPAQLDDITKVPFNGNPNTDVIKIFLNSRIKKISNMSVIGENF